MQLDEELKQELLNLIEKIAKEIRELNTLYEKMYEKYENKIEYKNDEIKCNGGIPPAQVSFWGELKVASELIKLGYDPLLLGGKKSIDILIQNREGTKIGIEVKTDRKKPHIKGNPAFGFDSINPKKFDFLIGISFDDEEYFLFPKKVCEKFPYHNLVGWGKRKEDVMTLLIYKDKNKLEKDLDEFKKKCNTKKEKESLKELESINEDLKKYKINWKKLKKIFENFENDTKI